MPDLASYVSVAGLLLIASIVLGRTSNRIGIPAFLTFLVIGMLAGEEGLGRLTFENYRLTFDVGTFALFLILFDGGLNTPGERLRQAIVPSSLLATVGVALTAVLTAVGVRPFGFSWTQSLLLGAILSSTDAAGVFLIIKSAGIRLKKRPAAILELESGLNDPMAFVITAVLTDRLANHTPITVHVIAEMGLSLLLGGSMGAAIGWLGKAVLCRQRPGAGGLYPVFTLAIAFLSFGLPSLVGGSGLLAAYVSGIVVGTGRIPYSGNVRRVHDSLAWLAQLSMFLVLGILATPSELMKAAIPGMATAFTLTLISRPIAVLFCLIVLRYPLRELTYIAAVGIRGAVPIVLATLPVVSKAPGAHEIFNIAFFGVIFNALVPGMLVGRLAKWLDLTAADRPAPPAILDISSAQPLKGGEIVSFHIDESSAAAGARVADLPLPPDSTVVLVVRDGTIIPPRGDTEIVIGDHLYLLCRREDQPFINLIFGTQEAD